MEDAASGIVPESGRPLVNAQMVCNQDERKTIGRDAFVMVARRLAAVGAIAEKQEPYWRTWAHARGVKYVYIEVSFNPRDTSRIKAVPDGDFLWIEVVVPASCTVNDDPGLATIEAIESMLRAKFGADDPQFTGSLGRTRKERQRGTN